MNDDEYFGLNKHHEPVNQYKQNNQYQTNQLGQNNYHNNQHGQNKNYHSNTIHRNTQQNTNDFRVTSFEKKDYVNVYKPAVDYNSNMLNSYDSLRSPTNNQGFEGKPLVDIKSNLLNTYNDLGKTIYQQNTVKNVPSFEKEHQYDPYNYFGTKDYSKTVFYNKDDTNNEVHNILYPANPVNLNNNVPQYEKKQEFDSYNKVNQGKHYNDEKNYALNPRSYVPSFEKEDSLYLKNPNTVPYMIRNIHNEDKDKAESYTETPEIKYKHMPLPNNPYRENTGDDNYNPYKEITGGHAHSTEVVDGFKYDPDTDPYLLPKNYVLNPSSHVPSFEKENTGDDYNPYKENTGGHAHSTEEFDGYKYDPATDPYLLPKNDVLNPSSYVPSFEKENTGDDYNPYKENTGGHAHSTEEFDGYKYDPATDPYAEPLYNPDKR